jgi:hypothetical protein
VVTDGAARAQVVVDTADADALGLPRVEKICRHPAASQQVLDLMALVDQHPGSSTGMISYG